MRRLFRAVAAPLQAIIAFYRRLFTIKQIPHWKPCAAFRLMKSAPIRETCELHATCLPGEAPPIRRRYNAAKIQDLIESKFPSQQKHASPAEPRITTPRSPHNATPILIPHTRHFHAMESVEITNTGQGICPRPKLPNYAMIPIIQS